MKILLFAWLSLVAIACNTSDVYICDSTTAARYHYKENCRGLKNCNYRIKKTTLDSAEKKGKTLCRWER